MLVLTLDKELLFNISLDLDGIYQIISVETIRQFSLRG
jgi:hypothetical protein